MRLINTFSASIISAYHIVQARRLRFSMMVFQFTVGLTVLVIFSLLVYQSLSITRFMQATFGQEHVVGFIPASTNSSFGSWISMDADDIAELAILPGIKDVAVCRQADVKLSDGSQIPIYIINHAYERLTRLRVSERYLNDKKGVAELEQTGIFITPETKKQLGQAPPPMLSFSLWNERFTIPLAGVAQPISGWPEAIGSVISRFESNIPALVISLDLVHNVNIPLNNSIWLVLEAGYDESEIADTVAKWYNAKYPTHTAALLSVQNEIKQRMLTKDPAIWFTGLLSAILLVMSVFGFAGHAMLTMETRRREWVLRMALGATKRQVIVQVLAEILLVEAVAAVLSVLIGFTVARFIYPNTYIHWLSWAPSLLCLVFILVFGSTMLTALYPLTRIRRQNTATILKESW